MEVIEFEEFDKCLEQYPKNLSTLIYEFYSPECKKCNMNQKYCIECNNYQCFCVKEINNCNVKECNKLLCCTQGTLLCNENCTCCERARYLCPRCWRIDIHIDILEDIELNGS